MFLSYLCSFSLAGHGTAEWLHGLVITLQLARLGYEEKEPVHLLSIERKRSLRTFASLRVQPQAFSDRAKRWQCPTLPKQGGGSSRLGWKKLLSASSTGCVGELISSSLLVLPFTVSKGTSRKGQHPHQAYVYRVVRRECRQMKQLQSSRQLLLELDFANEAVDPLHPSSTYQVLGRLPRGSE